MKNISLKTGIALITFFIGVIFAAVWINSKSQQLPVADVTLQTQPITVSNIPAASEESEKYAVYSAVLNEIFVKKGYQSLIIFDKPLSNNSPEKLKPNFDLPVSYSLVDENEFKNYVFGKERNLEQKNRKKEISDLITKQSKPIANVRLSQVIFNEEKTTAEVEVEYVYCPLCGFGKTVSLEKVEGIWKIQTITQGWVS